MLTKQNLSISLEHSLLEQIDILKDMRHVSRSHIIEGFLKEVLEKKLLEDAEALSHMVFDDQPSEENWHILQSHDI